MSKYEALSDDSNMDFEEGDKILPTHQRRASSSKLCLSILGFIVFAILVAQTINSLFTQRLTIGTLDQAHALLPHPRDNGSCGGSASEARQAGCVFDVVEFSWLPHRCVGKDAADYLNMADWKYYDDNKTEMQRAEAWKGESEYLWISWRQHLTHCTFMWKRLHRAALLKEPTDSYIADYEHTMHCADMLLRDGMHDEDVNVQLFVKFPTCGVMLDREDLGWPW